MNTFFHWEAAILHWEEESPWSALYGSSFEGSVSSLNFVHQSIQ